MAKQAALDAGADDAWMVEDGCVTEGSSNNAYIVTRAGAVVTRHLGSEILHGITRAVVLTLARERQIAIEERPFTVEEAKGAAEAFITSASTFVLPVVGIDGETVGGRHAGPDHAPAARDLHRVRAGGRRSVVLPAPARDGGAAAQSAASGIEPKCGAAFAPRRCRLTTNSRSKESATEPTTRSFASSASDHA